MEVTTSSIFGELYDVVNSIEIKRVWGEKDSVLKFVIDPDDSVREALKVRRLPSTEGVWILLIYTALFVARLYFSYSILIVASHSQKKVTGLPWQSASLFADLPEALINTAQIQLRGRPRSPVIHGCLY